MSAEPCVTVAHGPRPPRWLGNPRQYQIEAQSRYAKHFDRGVMPWSWVTTSCDTDHCLDPRCMTLHQPRRIEYPEGVCCYCGDPAGTRDHLLPKPLTGAALRQLVAVVPACADCNSRIGDLPTPNVAKRRKRAQLSIERANRALLLRPTKTADDLRDLGPALRSIAIKNNGKAERVRLRLAWPTDPYLDLRAFQQSGIEDPESLGLCDALATPLRPEYQEAS